MVPCGNVRRPLYSAAFAAKAYASKIPLRTLFDAAQFVDFLWAIFILTGVEKARIVPGLMAGSPLDLFYMPFTHSLLGVTGFVLGAALFSH